VVLLDRDVAAGSAVSRRRDRCEGLMPPAWGFAHDPAVRPNVFDGAGGEHVDLEDLFRIRTAKSIHVPLSDDARGLVSDRILALLPAGSVPVNVARGEVLDTAALLRAWSEGAWPRRRWTFLRSNHRTGERPPNTPASL
jgi:hypothetical protein